MVLCSGHGGRWICLLVCLLIAGECLTAGAGAISGHNHRLHENILHTAAASLITQTGWYRRPVPWLGGVAAAILLSWGTVTLRTRSLVRHRRKLERLVAERTAQLQLEKQALAAAREALQVQATHDSLTGIWNRAAILEHLEREAARAVREASVLSVIMADLDHFKQVNDSYGHLCGDRVLRESAQRLQGCLRRYDFIGRYGGEEFLILMPGCDPASNAGRFEAMLACTHGRPFPGCGPDVQITCSLGVTVLRPGGQAPSSEELLQSADEALYRAKQAGRNCVRYADIS